MKISANQAATIEKVMSILSQFEPTFWNYKDGVYSFNVPVDLSDFQIDGMKTISCKPHNGGYVIKFK